MAGDRQATAPALAQDRPHGLHIVPGESIGRIAENFLKTLTLTQRMKNTLNYAS